ncbi:hypothetical protein ACUNI2_27075, partial [Serratia sp. IR-2025]
KKSAQIREILISESAWEEMTCLFAPSLTFFRSWPWDYSGVGWPGENHHRKIRGLIPSTWK